MLSIPATRDSILFCRFLTGREFGPVHGTEPMVLRLPLAELEAPTRAFLSVFLAFLHARIARKETILAQRRTQFRIQLRERASDAHTHGSSLPAYAAALDLRLHLDLVEHLGEFQRLNGGRVSSHVSEVILHGPSVHRKQGRPDLDIHASHRFPPASGAVEVFLCRFCERIRG